jgi:hypothetical protein
MIDEMWHARILSTNEYFSFCNRYDNGDFHHHYSSMVDEPSRYRLTRALNIELFGELPKTQLFGLFPWKKTSPKAATV